MRLAGARYMPRAFVGVGSVALEISIDLHHVIHAIIEAPIIGLL